MKHRKTMLCGLLCFAAAAPAFATGATDHAPTAAAASPKAEQSVTQGSVTVEGKRIDYTATAGTIVLKDRKGHPTGSMALFGSDTGYATNLPTFAAVAWYHHKLPNQPAALQPFLQQVEQFAMDQYTTALNAGNTLSPDAFNAIAEKLHDYTGLSVAYIKKANLRMRGGEFLHELLGDQDLTVGTLDARFTGPAMDPRGRSSRPMIRKPRRSARPMWPASTATPTMC